MTTFSVKYLFELVDRFSPNASKMDAAMSGIQKSAHSAGAAADKLAASTGKIGGALGGVAGQANAAGRALAGYANQAEIAATRAAAAQRTMMRDQAFMAAGFKRGADGGWVGGPKGPGGPNMMAGGDRAMGGLAFAGFLSYFTGAGKKLFDTNLKFQTEFNNARAVMAKSTEEDFSKMEKSVISLSKNSTFSATQIMAAMGTLGSAGYEAREAMGVIPTAIKLAQAGRDPLDKTAETLIAIKNQYGIGDGRLDHIANVLAETSRQTLTALPQLRESFKMLGPFAEIAGIDLETSAAMLGELSQKGIMGSLAGTGARRQATAFLKNAKPMQNFMRKYKINPNEVYNKQGKIRDMVELVAMLERKGLHAGDVMNALGDRGGPILAALLNVGSKELKRLRDEVTNSAGAVEKMSEEQLRGLPGAFLRMKAAIEAARLSIGKAGFEGDMTSMVNRVGALANWFSSMPDGIQRAVGWVAMIGAALAGLAMPVALAAFAFSTLRLGAVAAGAAGLAAGLWRVVAASRLLLGLTGVGAALWIGYEVVQNWDALADAMGHAASFKIGDLKQQVVELAGALKSLFTGGGTKPALDFLAGNTADDKDVLKKGGLGRQLWDYWFPTHYFEDGRGMAGGGLFGADALARNSPSAAMAKIIADRAAASMTPFDMFPAPNDAQFRNMAFNAAYVPQSAAMEVRSHVDVSFQPAVITTQVTGTINGPVSGSGTGELQANPARGTSAAEAGAPAGAR